jgi:hypothetical protein
LDLVWIPMHRQENHTYANSIHSVYILPCSSLCVPQACPLGSQASIPPLVSLHTTANPSLGHSTLLCMNQSLFTSNSKPAGIISASLSILYMTSLHVVPSDLQWQHLTFSDLFHVIFMLLQHTRLQSSITMPVLPLVCLMKLT